MPFGIQPIHIVIVVIVALLIFGPKRLPEVGRWIGKSVTEFRKSSQEMTSALRDGINEGQQAEAQKNSIAQPTPAQSVPAVPAVPAGTHKFCIKCGASNPQEALFCNKCGNPFPTQA
jgi:TatA/E family protein of Tat protein translocase